MYWRIKSTEVGIWCNYWDLCERSLLLWFVMHLPSLRIIILLLRRRLHNSQLNIAKHINEISDNVTKKTIKDVSM